MTQSKFVGVDGCPYGWFSVGFSLNGDFEVKAFRTFKELLTYYQAAELVLVDIPIGLPEDSQRRKCDGEARDRLGARHVTVFTTPTRQTVQFVANGCDFEAANAKERKITGRGISKQAFAICRKIAEVDEALSARHSATPLVREVHPEICFWAFNRKKPMAVRKQKVAGEEKRKNVLQKIEPKTHEIFDKACKEYLRKCVARDDILDALAAAVTAYGGRDKCQSLPEKSPVTRDDKGLPMEMVFWIPQT